MLTFRLNHQFHELYAPAYHLVDVILHTIVSILVYLVVAAALQTLQQEEGGEKEGSSHKAVAFSAAALFAVHPVHTEAVANVTSRWRDLQGMEEI